MRTRTARIMRIMGHPLLKAFCRLLARVVPPAVAERTKNAQFLPPWCRRSGSNRRPAAYKAAALPLSYGGDGADCTLPRRSSGLVQFSLVCIWTNRIDLALVNQRRAAGARKPFLNTCAAS